MNLLVKIVYMMREEDTPLYVGEFVATLGYEKCQVMEVLKTLEIVGYVGKSVHGRYKLL